MTKETFLAKLADILDEDTLDETRRTDSITAFDSMGVMAVIVMFKRDLQVSVNANRLVAAQSVGDIVKIAADKLED
ncbi:MAG: hypothetical protein LBN39_08635 [Planctomycetaceae bacterium]|jgi:acyl carrier protein|nr:hypothetical protein [Planctomycetaceae bacterium]